MSQGFVWGLWHKGDFDKYDPYTLVALYATRENATAALYAKMDGYADKGWEWSIEVTPEGNTAVATIPGPELPWGRGHPWEMARYWTAKMAVIE